MTALTHWEPFTGRWNPRKEFEQMENRLASYFGRPAAHANGEKEAMTVAEWSPLVDITEDDKEYVIKAELPELKREDVKVSVQDNLLSISGERKSEKEEKSKKYHRVERTYGRFLRSFTLPENCDGAKVVAEYKDGVLKIRLPKSEQAKPKSIEVKVQ